MGTDVCIFLRFKLTRGTAGSHDASVFNSLRSMLKTAVALCLPMSHVQKISPPVPADTCYCWSSQRWPYGESKVVYQPGLHLCFPSDQSVKYHLMCLLGTCRSSLDKCLFRDCVHFKLGLPIYYWGVRILYKFWL